MATRIFTRASFEVDPDLTDRSLAAPRRRLWAFVVDAAVLFVPSVVVAVAASALSLRLSDPGALAAIVDLYGQAAGDSVARVRSYATLAPVLARIRAPGLPAAVPAALEEGDEERAGEILSGYDLDISLSAGTRGGNPQEGHVWLEVEELIPRWVRPAALFGVAALYFTLLTAGRRGRTLGKRILGIEVRRIDGKRLSWWESFERFGGYLASVGTFGLGLIDFWRDPNRRLAHDRIAETVVVRTGTAG